MFAYHISATNIWRARAIGSGVSSAHFTFLLQLISPHLLLPPVSTLYPSPNMKAVSLLTRILLCSVVSTVDALDGVIQLFDDDQCNLRRDKTSSIPLGACLGVNNSAAVSVLTFPNCATGSPYLRASGGLACGVPSIWPYSEAFAPGDCLSFSTGLYISSVRFDCTEPESTAKPSITTKPDPNLPTSSTSKPTSPSHQADPDRETAGELSLSDKIALGVGLSMGITTIIIAAWAGYYQMRGARLQIPRDSEQRFEYPDEEPPPYSP